MPCATSARSSCRLCTCDKRAARLDDLIGLGGRDPGQSHMRGLRPHAKGAVGAIMCGSGSSLILIADLRASLFYRHAPCQDPSACLGRWPFPCPHPQRRLRSGLAAACGAARQVAYQRPQQKCLTNSFDAFVCSWCCCPYELGGDLRDAVAPPPRTHAYQRI
jgi:hypothetical protein